MDALELQTRLKKNALRTVKVSEALPKGRLSYIIEDQLFRSVSSAAANYRAACKAISGKSFISNLSLAFQKGEEFFFSMEVIVDASLFPLEKMKPIMQESSELASILAASRKSAQHKLKKV